ncbi:MAG TPA: hypothetical protein VNL74_05360 [Methylococcus sp.]|nr:hypothetical protein [Methylococcus sp.]
MTGWKTRLGGWLAIVYGLVGWLLDLHDIDVAFQFLVNGFGILGIGHKIEKAGFPAVPVPIREDESDEALADFVRRQQR